MEQLFCKKLLLLIVNVFTFTIVFSQTQVLKVYNKDGEVTSFSFRDKPVFTIKDENLTLTTNEIVVTYPLVNFVKYTTKEINEIFNIRNITLYDDELESYSNTITIDSCNIRYIRSYNDTEWQSLYVPFDIDVFQYIDDFEFAAINNIRQYDDDNDGNLERIELEIRRIIDGTLIANFPYLIKSKRTGLRTINLYNTILYNSKVTSIDCSSIDLKFNFIGIYNAKEELCEPYSDYYCIDNGLFVKCYDVLPQAFRWYLKIEGKTRAADTPILLSTKTIDNKTDNISTTFSTPLKIYNLNGSIASKTSQTGVNIMMMKDGSTKKTLIKK